MSLVRVRSLAREPLSQAFEDAWVIYCHRVLPSSIRDGLPSVDSSWGDYGAQDDDAAHIDRPDDTMSPHGSGRTLFDRAYGRLMARDAAERSALGQANVLGGEIASIDGSPALHFVHVLLPHGPFRLSREGFTTSYAPAQLANPEHPGYPFRARLRFQLHSLQVGAADALVAELVEHLRALPTWRQMLLVVTSDHGDNHTPPDLWRHKVTAANTEEILRVPLFIKAPGQVEGDVRDDTANTIDVLPSIVDLVDAQVDWPFDGHSLYDASTAHTSSRVSPEVERVLAIAARRAEQFPHGDDWTALAAVGANGDLVGRRVVDLAIREPSRYRAALLQRDLFAELPTADGTLPFVLVGTAWSPAGSTDEEPPEFLAAVNGTLAGVVGGYEPKGAGWKFTGYVAEHFYRDGANTVALYEISRRGSTRTLHPVRLTG